MPRKRGRKTSSRKTTHSRTRRNVSRANRHQTSIKIVFTNLIVFVVLFLASLILYNFLSGIYQSLFFVFMLGFGVISAAFLITLVVFLFLKLFNKKR